MKTILPRLVRARPKPLEDWPEWAKCCECWNGEDVSKAQTLIVDLDSVYESRGYYCSNCNKLVKRPNTKGIVVALGHRAGEKVTFELLDLDEGPLERPMTPTRRVGR